MPTEQIPPAHRTNLSLLVLDRRDLEKTNPEQWLAYAPQAVIAAADTQPPGGTNWLRTQSEGWYQVTTDGKRMWVEKK